MMPGRMPMTLYRGDSYAWRVLIWLDTLREHPFDLSTVTVKAEIREEPVKLPAHVISCSFIAPNIIELSLSAFTCRDLPEAGVWDLQLTTADNQVQTILRGDVRVVDDVTDSRVIPEAVPNVAARAFPKGVRRA
jgi:hypothetical protein